MLGNRIISFLKQLCIVKRFGFQRENVNIPDLIGIHGGFLVLWYLNKIILNTTLIIKFKEEKIVYCAALNFMYSQSFEERDYYTLKYCVFYNCKL